MTIKVLGYAAQSAAAPLAPWPFERREPRADDVLIDILHCGVCHSDLHMARNDWNWSAYPLVSGHEIVGRVRRVGGAVTGFAAGDLVAGSAIGGIADTQELLDFCGAHGLVADIETIRMQDINRAFERLQASDVKYRFVIDMASLAEG